jgi:hypothetical protein
MARDALHQLFRSTSSSASFHFRFDPLRHLALFRPIFHPFWLARIGMALYTERLTAPTDGAGLVTFLAANSACPAAGIISLAIRWH